MEWSERCVWFLFALFCARFFTLLQLEFREDGMSVGILSERRALAPRGLDGGGDGARGRNTVFYSDGRVVALGPKNEVAVNRGDRIRIETPGGGGFGALVKR